MARFIYQCDCGFTIDGRRTQEISEHESNCPIATAANEMDEVKDMVAFFINSNDQKRVESVSKMLLQVDSDLHEFYEDEVGPSALSTVSSVKLFDFMLSVNERLKAVESKLEIVAEQPLEPQPLDITPTVKNHQQDEELRDKLFKAAQDVLVVSDEEDDEPEE
jgi:hypothetical protein